LASRSLIVHSFEPGNRASAELRLVARKYSNVTVYPVAAGVKDGHSKLYLHVSENTSRQDLTQASSLLSDKPNVDETNYEIVETIDFARFLKSLNARVSLIKIDIEGFEIELINHLLDSGCLERIDKIFVETHEKKWPSMRVPTLLLKNRVREMNLVDKIRFDWT